MPDDRSPFTVQLQSAARDTDLFTEDAGRVRAAAGCPWVTDSAKDCTCPEGYR